MSDLEATALTAVAVLNVALAAVLVLLYGRMYVRTRAPFAIGLVLFAAAFLAQNVLVAYAYGTMMPLFGGGLVPYLLSIGVFEALGLAAIAWTATR